MSRILLSIWAGARSCCLDMLDKLRKQVGMVVSPFFASSHESLTYPQKVVSPSLFYRYLLIFVPLNRVNWFHLLILMGVPLVSVKSCMIFLSLFLDEGSHVNSLFHCTTTFLDKIFETKLRNQEKFDMTRKLWYLLLRDLAATAEVLFLKVR